MIQNRIFVEDEPIREEKNAWRLFQALCLKHGFIQEDIPPPPPCIETQETMERMAAAKHEAKRLCTCNHSNVFSLANFEVTYDGYVD